MNLLALDGALGRFSAAAMRDGAPPVSGSIEATAALEEGLALAAEVLSRAGLGAESLDRIVVGVGPGGFTGTRIALSYAKSLAQGWQLPLVPVDSFAILDAAYGRPNGPRIAVVSGRKGVVSVALQGIGSTKRASGYIAEAVAALGSPAPGEVAVLGAMEDVLAALREAGWNVRLAEPVLTPPALAAAEAASELAPARSLHEVRADYGELPAARIPTSLPSR